MKLKLVHPNFTDQIYPSLTLTAIASWVNRAQEDLSTQKHRATIIDLSFHRRDWEKYLNQMIQNGDVVGFSVTTLTFSETFSTIRWLRKHFQSLYIICGGIGVSIDPEYFFSEADGLVNGICIGDAEGTIDEVLDCLEQHQIPQNILGFWVYDTESKSIHKTDLRPLMIDLDETPFLDYSLWDPRHFEHIAQLPMQTSRSCLYNCAFCSQTALKYQLGGEYYRTQSFKRICDEMEYQLEKWHNVHGGVGFKGVVFFDDTFTANAAFITSFCEELKKRQLHHKIRWECNARVDTLTPQRIRLMGSAGCYFINLGIESADESIRKFYGKPFSNEKIGELMKSIHLLALYSKCFYIIGGPMDSLTTSIKTITFAQHLKSDFFNVTPFFAIYGTKGFDAVAQNDPELKDNYQKIFNVQNVTKPAHINRVMASVVLGHEVSILKTIPLILSAMVDKDLFLRLKVEVYVLGLINYGISMIKHAHYGLIGDFFRIIPKMILYRFTMGDIVHETLKKYVLNEGWRRHPNV